MKVSNIFAVLLSALFSVAISTAPLGEASSENDKIFSGENYMIVKKDMEEGEQVKPHDHPGFKTSIPAVGEDSFDVTLNQTKKHIAGAGSVLRFGGDAVIETVVTEDANMVITSIK